MEEKKIDVKEVWDNAYKESMREELGWYESVPEPSLSLIKKYVPSRYKEVLDAGCGESTLLQSFIDNGFKELAGMDLSSEAIKFQKENLKYIQGETEISLKVGDLTEKLNFEKKGTLWHDRAVFHFIFEDSLRKNYKENVKKYLEDDGIFILACFSRENEAERCNGLLVNKQNVEDLEKFFEDSFVMIESLKYSYTMPWGDVRKYIYCIFSKKSYNLS